LLLLALLLAWGVGLFARSYWTPDEPREAALANTSALPSNRCSPPR
jgi:hypothetical protein